MERTKTRLIVLVLTGAAVGGVLLSPVGAHVGTRIGHLWNDHIEEKADARYVQRADNPWARVGANGEVKASSGAVGDDVYQPQEGVYAVKFKRVVSKCAFTATSLTNSTVVSARPARGGPKSVLVEVVDVSEEAFKNSAFSIVAHC